MGHMVRRDEEDDFAPSPYEAAWDAVRAGLKRSVGPRTFDGWLKPVTLVDFDSATATVCLAAPSDFMATWVETHFAEQLLAAWKAMLPQVARISIAAATEAQRPALFAIDEPARNPPRQSSRMPHPNRSPRPPAAAASRRATASTRSLWARPMKWPTTPGQDDGGGRRDGVQPIIPPRRHRPWQDALDACDGAGVPRPPAWVRW